MYSASSPSVALLGKQIRLSNIRCSICPYGGVVGVLEKHRQQEKGELGQADAGVQAFLNSVDFQEYRDAKEEGEGMGGGRGGSRGDGKGQGQGKSRRRTREFAGR